MDNYKETYKTWNKVAAAYQDKFMGLSLYDDTYAFFCDAIGKVNATVLEIGCGPGNITKYLLNKRPDFKIEGIDVAGNMIGLAKLNNPTANFKVMDCREIDRLTSKFSGIVCGFCLPYLSEPDCFKLIENCAELLENDGILYLSYVAGDYQNSGFQISSSGNRVYFYYYTLKKFTEQLIANGFEVMNVIDKNYETSATAAETHTVLIAKKTV